MTLLDEKEVKFLDIINNHNNKQYLDNSVYIPSKQLLNRLNELPIKSRTFCILYSTEEELKTANHIEDLGWNVKNIYNYESLILNQNFNFNLNRPQIQFLFSPAPFIRNNISILDKILNGHVEDRKYILDFVAKFSDN